MDKKKLAAKLGKGLMKTAKTFGLKSSDIVEFIDEAGIESFAANLVDKAQTDNDVQTVILIGTKENDSFYFRMVSAHTNESGKIEIGAKIPMTIFDKIHDKITLSEILAEIIKKIF